MIARRSLSLLSGSAAPAAASGKCTAGFLGSVTECFGWGRETMVTIGSGVRVGLLAAAVLVAGAAPASAGLIVMCMNDNPQYAHSNVFMTFGGDATGFVGNIVDGGT
jgi:hypothetical protein